MSTVAQVLIGIAFVVVILYGIAVNIEIFYLYQGGKRQKGKKK